MNDHPFLKISRYQGKGDGKESLKIMLDHTVDG